MSSSDSGTAEVIPNPPTPQPLLLYLFSGMMALSILCYVFVFYHFSTNSTVRRRLNNHVILLLLAIYFIQTIFDTPLHLDFFRRGIYWPPSLNYCFLLLMLDYVTYEIALQLMLWASIERHILIFNPSMFNTPKRRLLGHFLPLSYCFIYPPSTTSISSSCIPVRDTTISKHPAAWSRVSFGTTIRWLISN